MADFIMVPAEKGEAWLINFDHICEISISHECIVLRMPYLEATDNHGLGSQREERFSDDERYHMVFQQLVDRGIVAPTWRDAVLRKREICANEKEYI